MASINKSFLCGICFASITWAVSLYLYWQLNKREFDSTPTNSALIHTSNDKRSMGKSDSFSRNAKYNYSKYKNNINSDMVIAKLQPIIKNGSEGKLHKIHERK